MKTIKFSILIPAYKSKYLAEAIESVLAQTFTNFELVIVDDKSPDDLKSIVDRYSDERLKYHRNIKNFGARDVVCNWNECLAYSTGDYVICMGDDDRLLPNCLEEYASLIYKYPKTTVFHAWTQIIDENSCVSNMQEARPEYESALSFLWHRWKYRNHQYIGDFLFESNELKKYGGFYYIPYAWGSDDITSFRASLTNGIVNTQEPCFQYRENSFTISNTLNACSKADAVLLEKEWYEKKIPNIIAQNMQDRIFLSLISEMLNCHFDKKIKTLLRSDLYNNPNKILKWRKKRNLNISSIYMYKTFISMIWQLVKDKIKRMI